MSEIPYYFEFPVPKYFRESGWFENENTFKFVTWAFSRCSSDPHKVIMDGKEVILEPFEFIAGRLTSHKECHLTEKQFRGQAERMQKEGILQKRANSRANRYTVYGWVTERFCKTTGQLKGQQRANSGPTEGHKQELRTIDIKKTPPYPPKGKPPNRRGGVSFHKSITEVKTELLSDYQKGKLTEEFTNEQLTEAIDYAAGIENIDSLYGLLGWYCRQEKNP